MEIFRSLKCPIGLSSTRTRTDQFAVEPYGRKVRAYAEDLVALLANAEWSTVPDFTHGLIPTRVRRARVCQRAEKAFRAGDVRGVLESKNNAAMGKGGYFRFHDPKT